MKKRKPVHPRTWVWLLLVIIVLIVCFWGMLRLTYGQPLPPPPILLPITGSVTLAWDPSPDSGVASYRAHWGPSSGFYTSVTNVGLVTNATIYGLIPLETNYFAITAVGTNQLESDFSNEIAYTVPDPQPAAPQSVGLVNVVVVNMKLRGRDSEGDPWEFIAEIPVIVKSDKPTGFFQVELESYTLDGVNW